MQTRYDTIDTYLQNVPSVFNCGPNHGNDVEGESNDQTHVDGQIVFKAGMGKDEIKVDCVHLREKARSKRSQMVRSTT